MKPLLCLILALSTVLVCSDMSAQERMFGKGRFLKKLRDDIAKSQQKAEKDREKEKSKNSKSKANTPTLARKNKSDRNKANSSQKTRKPTNSSSVDFGMVIVKNKKGDLVVSKVAPKGNAAQAGIRPGDKITELGGAELNDASEIETISEILKPGDQMEFTIDSRGKIRKQLVQWGEVPDIDEEFENSVRFEKNLRANESLKSIVEPPASAFPSSARATTQNSRSLSRIVAEQRRQIQALRRQLQQRSNQLPRLPIVDGPAISGPGK